MFGYSSKEWREKNPELVLKGYNMRDLMDTHQLIVLSNLESLNSTLLKIGMTDKRERFKELRKQATSQLSSLRNSHYDEHQLIDSPNKKDEPKNNSFDTMLKGMLNTPPMPKEKK